MPEPDLLHYHEGRSEKHVRDIRRMFEVSSATIDEPLLESELARRGLLETYRQRR